MNLHDLLLRFKAIFLRRRVEAELEEELQTHLELQIRKHVAAGMGVREAWTKAHRDFGGLELAKENCRDARRVNVIDNFLQDFRYAVRGLRRDSVLTLVALSTLAVCIGANTTVFSIVDSVMVRPLPYPSPERLYWISERMGRNRAEAAIGADYYSLREQNRVFEDVAAYSTRTVNLTRVEKPEQLDAALVTPSFFKVFASGPLLGRTLSESEQGVKAPQVAIVSFNFWRTHMASDSRAIGKTILLDGLPRRVIGVMPQGFDYPKGIQIWSPLSMDERNERPRRVDRPMHLVRIVARLKPHVSERQLSTELSHLTSSIYREYPPEFVSAGFLRGLRITAIPLQRQIVGDLRPALLILSGAVALLLLIACANLANLLLARATARTRELAMRMALGSGTARIVKQVLTESLVLAVPGGALGVVIALSAIAALNAWQPVVLQSYPPLALDVTTLGFSAGLTILTALIFGMAPAWTAGRIRIQEALKSTGPVHTGSRTAVQIRRLLVVTQLGIALVLLIGAGLLSRSFVKLATTDLGFPPGNILTLRLNLTGSRYATARNQVQFYGDVLDRVKQLPQVKGAAFSSDLPLSGDDRFYSGAQFEVVGYPLPIAKRPHAGITVVSREFFKTLQVPLRAGRLFNSEDTEHSRNKIVVNEAFARTIFPAEEALNRRINIGPNDPVIWRIVGVVGNIRGGQLGAEPLPLIYRCLCQGGGAELARNGLIVRTAGDPHNAIHGVVGQILSVDREEPVFDIKTMDERLAGALAPRRFHLLLIGTFTAIAILLSAVGVFGVMSYLVMQRNREIGIRIAIGAQSRHVLNLVLKESLVLTSLGITLGVAGAWALTRYLNSMLYGVSSLDALTFALMPVVLTVVAVSASLIPAAKAVRIDPIASLREE
jgi:putative ABC transport system permease protein